MKIKILRHEGWNRAVIEGNVRKCLYYFKNLNVRLTKGTGNDQIKLKTSRKNSEKSTWF